MRILDFAQGSDEWRAARAGIVTASGISNLVTDRTLKPSASAEAYMNRLIAERVLGRPIDDATTGFMERGLAMEADAVAAYEYERGIDTTIVGMVLTDDGQVACSPDRLVGDDGGLEIKCPAIHTHVAYLRKPDALRLEYRSQVQGGLLVTGRKWWDLRSHNPEFPAVTIRCEVDVEWRRAVEPILRDFLALLNSELARILPMREAAMAANPFL